MRTFHSRQKFRSFASTAVYFLPALAVILSTILVPFFYAIYLSFHKWNLKYPERSFVWFDNYLYFLKSGKFWNSFLTTVQFSLLAVCLTIFLGFLIALVLNQKFRGRFILRAFLLIPWAVPEIANGILWQWILNPSYGILNRILKGLGLITTYQSWMDSMPEAMFFLVLAYSWTHVPLAALIILASFQTISEDIFDASKIDGVSRINRLLFIVIPLIRDTLLVLIIFETIFALKVFDIIYVLTGGGPGNSTSVIGWEIYTRTFGNLDFGRGSTLAMILGFITMIFSMLYFFHLKTGRSFKKRNL